MSSTAYLSPLELLERYRTNTLRRDRDRTLAQANNIPPRAKDPAARDLRDSLLADVGAIEMVLADFSNAIRRLKGSR